MPKRPAASDSSMQGRKKFAKKNPTSKSVAVDLKKKGKQRVTSHLSAKSSTDATHPSPAPSSQVTQTHVQYTVIEQQACFEDHVYSNLGTYDTLEAANAAAKKHSEDHDFSCWEDYKEEIDEDGFLHIQVTAEREPYQVFVRPKGATARPPVYVVMVRDDVKSAMRFQGVHLRFRSANLAVQTHASMLNAKVTSDQKEWMLATIGKVRVAEIRKEFIYDLPDGLEKDKSYQHDSDDECDSGDDSNESDTNF